MEFIYKRASLADLEELLKIRIEVLRTVYEVDEQIDMSAVEATSREYYKKSLLDGSHITYLVHTDEGEFVGVGGVSFYQIMPTYDNPTGKKAYIMNMYTRPDFRRKGIAMQILDLLVKESKDAKITFIALDASEVGRLVYEKYGFVKMEDEMRLISK